jgi:hypothetical protein
MQLCGDGTIVRTENLFGRKQMVKALRSWMWISAIVLASRRMWAEDLSSAIGERSLRMDINRPCVHGLLCVVILLLARTAAYSQISLPLPGNIDTVAGYGPAGYAGDNGLASAADLNGPHNVAIDAAGNIYIADMWNNCIRKVTASTGIITTVAGNGIASYSGDGGAATSAELYHPSGVALDTAGNIYIADYANNRIRKVTVSTNDISTVAGNGTAGYNGDGGSAISAELNTPYSVAVDTSGNIYISDTNNYRIRKVTVSTGVISTVAGTGAGGYTGNGGPAVSAKITQAMGLALDTSSNIYFADWGNAVIREVTASTGNISTVAGSGSNGFSGDGGPATAAKLYYPYGVAVDTAGNIYIADDVNNRIRKVSASTGNISTVAGNGAAGYSGDGGAATSAALEYPYGVALDTANNIYIADEGNNRIRAVGQVKATPSIFVSCSPNPIAYGSETTTCTATLSGGATGTVTWTINGGAWTTTSLSGGTTSAGGFSGWNAGTYTIGVAYGGDSNNNPVSSSTTLTISKATPTVSVFCSPNPITYGGANSICTISASDNGTVSGTVSLTYNGIAWTTLPLSSGSGTATWSSTSGIGTYTIGATYNGDSNNTTATGSGTVTVNKTSPTVTLSSSVNPLNYGGLSVFTATINGGQSPSGTVTFQVNGQTFGTVTVSGGVAIYNGTNEAWAAGTDTISAIYSGDGDNSGATGTLSETINKATPTISWATPGAITYGTALGATQLNASSSVAGTFVYTPATGTVLTAGSSSLSVTLTPTDSTDYNTAAATVTLTVNKATPTITWATPAAITFGTALSAMQLNASSTTAGTFVYTPSAGTVLGAGSQTLSVAFTPTDMTDYNTATATATLTVNKATPTITWATPAAITYGTALNATQLDASSTTAGSFVYTPAFGTVLTAGTQTLSVTLSPTDATDYNTATDSVTLNVIKATPTITWAGPAAITYGTALSATQLDASSGVAGTFAYSPAFGTVLMAGSHTLSVTFTPTDITDYSSATQTVLLAVNKATPSITWATPAAITYGTALSSTQLDASSTVTGAFAYTPSSGTVLTAGSQTLSVTLTPSDTTDYNSATGTVILMVSKATPTITWVTPAPITYGTALSATQLNASSTTAGTFAYTPSSGTVLTAGSQTLSVTLNPTDTTDYNMATTTVTLMVNRVIPTITWATPAAITYGTALSATQLDASSGGVAGTFAYTPASGTVLTAGSQTLSVTFTPTDTTDYNTATAAVLLTVNKATPNIIWATPAAITYGTALSATQLNASSTTAGAFVYTPATGTVLTAGSHTLSVTITPTDTTDYNTAIQTVPLTVNKTTPTITWATPAAITYGTALSVTQLDATAGGVAGSFAYTPAAGTVLGVGSQTLSVTFNPTDTTDYNTATGSVTLQVTKSSVLINGTSSLKPSVYGDSVTWTFTFVGGGITPTGTTTIKDGSVTLATVGLNAGIATYTTSALVAGSHTLTAVYSGDNNYQ